MSVNGVAPSQSVPNNQDRDDLGIGQLASYIPNQDENIPDGGQKDTITASSPGITPRNKAAAAPVDQGPEYLDNSSGYDASLTAGNAMNNADEATSDLMNSLEGEDFIVGPDGEYQTVDGSKLADLLTLIAKLATAEMMMKMLTDAQMEESQKLMEIILELKPEEGDTSADAARAAFFKSMQDRMKILQQFMTSVYKAVYNHNFELWQQRMNAIEKDRADRPWYEGLGNWFTGGDDLDHEEQKKAETQKFNASVKNNLHELMTALQALAAAFELMGNQAAGRGIASVLREFEGRIEQANLKLDQPVVGNGAGGLDGWDIGLSIFHPELQAGRLIAQGDNSPGTDYFDDDDAKNFLQDILTELRGKMVALENTARAETFAQTAQMEESQSVREILLDLSPHTSKAEYAYASQESMFKLGNLFFDTAFSTLSNRIQFYNTEVAIQINVDKMKEAQGWHILGTTIQIVGVIAAIVVTAATYGSGSVLAPMIIGGAAAAAGALCQGVGAYEASQVPNNYDVGPPLFSVGGSTDLKQPRNVVEAIDYTEDMEEQYLNGLSSEDFMIKNADGTYAVNSQAVAAMELRTQTFHNLLKMIAYLQKAMRDISRAVSAVVQEYTVKDFGDNYLLGNLENTVQQRTLIVQSIKMQLSEQVNGKNIQRQNEIEAHNAFGASKWGVIGEMIGFALYFVPYVGQFAGIAMALGGILGSSLYQMYDLNTSQYSSLHNDFHETSQDLDKRLSQRSQAAANSDVAEDKLAGLENACFAELAANGYISTGDGYHGVNYGLVGKLYNALMKIQTLRQMLAELRQGQNKISAAVRQQVTGTSGEVSELGKVVVQGAAAEAMTIMQGLVRFIADRAQVMNRQRDAEKQLSMAKTQAIVGSALAVAGGAAGGAIGGSTGRLIVNLTPSVMGLANAAASGIMYYDYAHSGFGDYEGYADSEKTVKDIKGNTNRNDEDPLDGINALQEQIYLEAGENLARSLSGSTWVMDGGMNATLGSRLHAVSNLLKMLMTLVTAKDTISSGVRRHLRAGGAQGVDELLEYASAQERAAQNILNSLTQGIEIMIERHNQMSQAQTQVFVSGLSAAISIASMALYVAAFATQPAEPGETEPGAGAGQKTSPPRTDAAAAGAKTAQAAELKAAPAGTEPKVEAKKAGNAYDAPENKGTLSKWLNISAITLNIMSPLFQHYIKVHLYEDRQPEKKANLEASKLDANHQPSRAAHSKAEKSGGNDIFDTINGLETEAEASDIMASSYATQTAAELMAQRAEEMVNAWFQAVKSGADNVAAQNRRSKMPIGHSSPDKADKHAGPAGPNVDKAMQDWQDKISRISEPLKKDEITHYEAQRRLNEQLKIRPEFKDSQPTKELQAQIAAKAAAASVSPAASQPKPIEFKPKQEPAPNTKGQREYVSKLLADVESKIREVQTKAATVANNSAEASQAPVATDGEKPATPEEQIKQLEAQKARLLQRLDELGKALKELSNIDLPAVKEKVVRLTKEVDARQEEIKQQLDTIEKQLTQQPPLSGDEQTALLKAQADLEAEKEMLEQVKPRLAKELKEVQAKIAQNKGEITSVRAEVMGLNRQIAVLQREKEKVTTKDEKPGKAGGLAGAAAASRGDKVLAVGAISSQLGRNRQETFHDKVKQAEEDKELVTMAQGGGSVIRGGFSC
ncbi:MAG: hypothetical protein JW873_01250 [Candidatus Saganbacteria bacterium]|nr:hypothetical protein [Candidatus Saganbacteria bacterium]